MLHNSIFFNCHLNAGQSSHEKGVRPSVCLSVKCVHCSDVTIIESKIEIKFFFENRIESKSIFLAGIFSILTHGYIGEDNALLRVQSMTAEPWQRVLNTPT